MRKEFDNKLSQWTVRLPFFNLRARLLLLGTITLLPAFGFVLYSTLEQRREVANQARDNALHLLQLAALDQKHLVGGARQQLLTMAQLPIVRDRALAGQCNRTFAKLRKQHRHYNNLGVADRQGNIYCSGAPLTAPVNIADRDYFRAAIATRTFSISDYQIGRVVKRSVVAFGYPVLDDAGTVQGVAFVSIDLATWFKELAASVSLPQNASLLLVNDRGTILARHPDAELWMGKAMPDKPLINAIAAGPQTGRVEDIGLDGVQRLYVFTQVHTTSADRVFMVAGIPSANLYAEANKIFLGGLVGILLVAAMVGSVAWFGGSRLILSPVLALINAVKKIGQGDLRARTHLPHSAGEFGQLARSFDDMAAVLQTRQSEAAHAAARFTNIVNLAADAIISMDENQHIHIFNQGAERIFGYTAAEVAGQPLDMLLPAHLAEAHRAHVRRFATEPETARDMNRRAEIHGRRRDGTEFPAEGNISKVTENGKIQFTVILRDISARKQAEEEIRQINVNLDRRVIERTAELQAANQELEAFSYSVSHDLRAPLRTIDGFSQAVLEDCADQLGDQGREHLNRVRAATQNMGHLIDDMLKLARVTRAEMKREAVDLSALANSVLANLQTSAPERKMDWHIEPGLVASGDAPLLRVVLDNLLGNAWKFTAKQSHACIDFGALQASPVMDEAERVGNPPSNTGGPIYFVRDNGVGFDMTYAGKLFGAFQRLHNVSEFPGTGIGLATVQRIIHRHGGRVWAESTPGKGATFYFSLD